MALTERTVDNADEANLGVAVIDLGAEGDVEAVALPAIWASITVAGFSPASLASASTEESDTIDNTASRFREVLIDLKLINHASSAPTSAQAVYLGIIRSLDGTDFEDSPGEIIGQLDFTAAAQTKRRVFSSRVIGTMSPYFRVAILNSTGAALGGTQTSPIKVYGVA